MTTPTTAQTTLPPSPKNTATYYPPQAAGEIGLITLLTNSKTRPEHEAHFAQEHVQLARQRLREHLAGLIQERGHELMRLSREASKTYTRGGAILLMFRAEHDAVQLVAVRYESLESLALLGMVPTSENARRIREQNGETHMSLVSALQIEREELPLCLVHHAGPFRSNVARCAGCARERPSSLLKLCSRCRLFQYCGAECQHEDWRRRHRYECKAFCQHAGMKS
jgi:hypothetical protein